MKRQKDQIRLLPGHPSLLAGLSPQSGLWAPLVIDQNTALVDGYRRWQMSAGPEVEVVQIETSNLFETAHELNLHTRAWDSIDQFLWMRWAKMMGVETQRFAVSFPETLMQAPDPMIRSLASRKLQIRQVLLILEAPARFRDFFHEFLTDRISLNVNETANFIEMACDLLVRMRSDLMKSLFEKPGLAEILENPGLTPRQKGEALLKTMRILRYPEYQKKLKGVSFLWRESGLDRSARIKVSEFVERGVLEISMSSASQEEMNQKVTDLYQSLASPVWDKIWEDP